MTGAEKGFLLLTSRLGNPDRRVLTVAQLRILAGRVQNAEHAPEDRELTEQDLVAMGYGREMAGVILSLLEEDDLLIHYCRRGAKTGCLPLARASRGYPRRLVTRLGEETPGCLWYKGDISLLGQPTVALVGSRDIRENNAAFAREVGKQAARQGYVLVSGNARGADQIAQRACLHAGGRVICVVADGLADKPERENVLYLSEDEFDSPFSPQRAISRNRVIHALGQMTFVAQCGYKTGGTWDGTTKNLRHNWSSVYCFADGSPAVALLTEMGAQTIEIKDLGDFSTLGREVSLFDQ